MHDEAYLEGLGPLELTKELQLLVAGRRRSLWLICRYLADLADVQPGRGGFRDALLFAWRDLGLSRRRARDYLRVGRALRDLPAIEREFVCGRLGYARVREVVRVATPDTEAEWLEVAQRLPRRTLEAMVSRAAGEDGAPGPFRLRPRARDGHIHVELRLSDAAWRRLSELIEAACADEGPRLSDEEAVERVVTEAWRVLARPVPNLGDDSETDPTGSEDEGPAGDPPGDPTGSDLDLQRRDRRTDPASPASEQRAGSDAEAFERRPGIRRIGAAPDCAGPPPDPADDARTSPTRAGRRRTAVPEALLPEPWEGEMPLSPVAARMREVLRERVQCTPDELAAAVGASGSELVAGLGELEVAGVADRVQGGYRLIWFPQDPDE